MLGTVTWAHPQARVGKDNRVLANHSEVGLTTREDFRSCRAINDSRHGFTHVPAPLNEGGSLVITLSKHKRLTAYDPRLVY